MKHVGGGDAAPPLRVGRVFPKELLVVPISSERSGRPLQSRSTETHDMQNATQGQSLATIADMLANGEATAADAIATLNERLSKAKEGSYKARRTALAIAQIESAGTLNVKAAFEAAKGKPKAAAKPKASKAKAAKPEAETTTDLGSLVAGMSPEDKAELVALVMASMK